MNVNVVLLPRHLAPDHLEHKLVVVFDVLRATTTMTAALTAGVREIRIFGQLEAALAAARVRDGPRLLCGEVHAAKPPGFDLGNSPGAFDQDIHSDTTLFMATTNGTKAILAAAPAARVLIGALVNASAVAAAVAQIGLDATLLCSGTDGDISTEDVLGAGAVIDDLQSRTAVNLSSDTSWMAHRLFLSQRADLQSAMSLTRGGKNVARAGLAPDIAFAANLNSFDVVGAVRDHEAVIVRWQG